jgi:hypothetical protein
MPAIYRQPQKLMSEPRLTVDMKPEKYSLPITNIHRKEVESYKSSVEFP